MSRPASRLETLFAEALPKTAVDRAALLERVRVEDAEIHRRLVSLLAAHDTPDSLLRPPSLQPALLPEDVAGVPMGRYKLVQKIGEGGCGVVYLAEQQAPVRRQVALKVIKLGMDTQDVIVRFEAERQALALMDHPNIAKVFDAGATETGRPYFVMELVTGKRITTYCDEHDLPTDERLKLFARVCQAIQHAHQKGVIHRDIKPSNILVAEHDGVAVPKVIDFGIAKATHGRLTDRTVLTAIAQFIGTPVYMSPEQAELKAIDIDTRSDIYSLGVLLYELIAGRPPFDPQTLASGGIDEIRRHIREIEPPRPSTRLSTLSAGERTEIAQRRGTEPGKLSLQLRGDLDWIVMRCLEKDRARRYETASALAADVHRYLEHQPVSATPPSAVYRVKKLVWRHKFAFAAGGAFTFLLIAGSIVSTWQAVRAIRAEKLADSRLGSELAARRDAEEQRRLAIERLQSADASRIDAEQQRQLAEMRLRSETLAREDSERQKLLAEQERRRALMAEKAAQAEAEISKAVNDFLQDDLLRQADSRVQAGTGAKPNADLKVREALDRAAERVEGRFGNRPLVEAGIRAVIGKTYMGMGEVEKAVAQLERALTLRRTELGSDESGTISLMHQLTIAYQAQGKPAAATAIGVEALDISRRMVGERNNVTLTSMVNLAGAYHAQGRLSEATALSEQALDTARQIYGAEHSHALTATNNLAVLYLAAGKARDAAGLFVQVIKGHEKLSGSNAAEAMSAMSNLGHTYVKVGNFEDAVKVFTTVFETRKRVFGPEHPDTLAAMSGLASVHRRFGNAAAALSLLDPLLEMQRRVIGPEHPDTLQSQVQLGMTYWMAGREQDARALLLKTAEAQTRVLGGEHPDTVNTLSTVAEIYHVQGKLDDAAALFRQSNEIRRRVLGRTHQDTYYSARNLGRICVDQEKFAEAEELLLAGCYNDLTSGQINGFDIATRDAELERLTSLLANLYFRWGDMPRAAQWRERLFPNLRHGPHLSGVAQVSEDDQSPGPRDASARSRTAAMNTNPSTTTSSSSSSRSTPPPSTPPTTATPPTTKSPPPADCPPASTGGSRPSQGSGGSTAAGTSPRLGGTSLGGNSSRAGSAGYSQGSRAPGSTSAPSPSSAASGGRSYSGGSGSPASGGWSRSSGGSGTTSQSSSNGVSSTRGIQPGNPSQAK